MIQKFKDWKKTNGKQFVVLLRGESIYTPKVDGIIRVMRISDNKIFEVNQLVYEFETILNGKDVQMESYINKFAEDNINLTLSTIVKMGDDGRIKLSTTTIENLTDPLFWLKLLQKNISIITKENEDKTLASHENIKD